MQLSLKKIRNKSLSYLRRLPPNCAPSLFIVGAQKCGTTSLASYLTQHPDVQRGREKELRYYSNEDRYSKGIRSYMREFPGRWIGTSETQTYDATPEYLYLPFVPERIHKDFPDAKIIVMLRDPIARAYSAWNMYCDFKRKGVKYDFFVNPRSDRTRAIRDVFLGEREPEFMEVVNHELELMRQEDACLEPSILRRGFYAEQIERYQTLFMKGVHVMFMEELVADPARELKGVLNFLGLSDSSCDFDLPQRNVRKYASPLAEEEMATLREIYAPHDERLRVLLDRSLPWDSAESVHE